MARKVYDTGQASAEEVSDVLQLLAEHEIPHYQTPSGVFGLISGALWVRDDADYVKARALIEDYDRVRAQRVRAEYAQRNARPGQGPLQATLRNARQLLSERPSEAILYFTVILLLIALHVLFFQAFS
ncbi:MAG: DUF6164 family protein [Acidiferrobacterales bacterium]|nr:DUF6164 family protein [Acidiferrobacterales bacterium]